MATEAPLTPDELRRDLEDAGVQVVDENTDAAGLAQAVVRSSPDMVIAASASPSDLMFEAARMLGTLAPCPFIMFTSDGDSSKIERASDSGVHAYVIDGYAKHRLLSIIQVARARFRHEQVLKDDFAGLSQRYEERKLIDRAKGVLMRSRRVTEDEAFELLRGLAMRSRQRIGVVAQSVIDMSRAGEAVNRSGQLRMLSQRIVKCYAQALSGLDPEEALLILSDSVVRVESNLGILRKAISTKGYGELVDRVAASWRDVFVICAERPDGARVDLLDARADAMLKDAETLTEFLESSGLVASLHVLNVAGRQRMLSQRITKLCFLLALEPSGSRLTNLRELTASFQKAMDYLIDVPLSSAAIRVNLQAATTEWQRLSVTLESLDQTDALVHISDASERLLDVIERLTDQYEQAMQMLIGDRIGRMR
jgi:AmiR/NasT family two-component response regulator